MNKDLSSELHKVSIVKKQLSCSNIRPQKSLGQNFLVDKRVLEKIVEAADLKLDDFVLEVGSGIGTLTQEIASKVKKVWAVEIDFRLIAILKENLKSFSNVEIINQDILKLNFSNLQFPISSLQLLTSNLKVLGSIPYQITSPLIYKLLLNSFSGARHIRHSELDSESLSFVSKRGCLIQVPPLIVFLVQKEVAEKICAESPKATYLSNLVSLFGKAETKGKVKPSSFWPRPRVDSTILKIAVDPKLVGEIKFDPQEFTTFLHHGFSHPRKMLNKVFSKKELEKAGIDPRKRPQELELEDWKKLYDKI